VERIAGKAPKNSNKNIQKEKQCQKRYIIQITLNIALSLHGSEP
jgi:hypothetical protein